MNTTSIGMFDSGIGGLSILRATQKLLPHESFMYVADQAHMPYGSKSPAELEKLVEKIVTFLLERQVKAIVIACNTATVYTIEYLRRLINVPVIGVVPVVKPLVETTKTKHVALLATPATTQSQYLKDLIAEFASGVTVEIISGENLAELVEQIDTKENTIREVLTRILGPLAKTDIDAIGLGSTHYAAIKPMVDEIVGSHVTVLDSGEAVARQVARVVGNREWQIGDSEQTAESRELRVNGKGKTENIFYTTGDPEHFQLVAERILGKYIANVYPLTL